VHILTALSSHESSGPTKIEMSLVDGRIVQVTRMDGEEMEVESSS